MLPFSSYCRVHVNVIIILFSSRSFIVTIAFIKVIWQHTSAWFSLYEPVTAILSTLSAASAVILIASVTNGINSQDNAPIQLTVTTGKAANDCHAHIQYRLATFKSSSNSLSFPRLLQMFMTYQRQHTDRPTCNCERTGKHVWTFCRFCQLMSSLSFFAL